MASGHANRTQKAEHMAAPTQVCDVKILLANSEPSTHGPLAPDHGLMADGRYRS